MCQQACASRRVHSLELDRGQRPALSLMPTWRQHGFASCLYRNFGGGEADTLLLSVPDGVVLAQEDIAQDPERACRQGRRGSSEKAQGRLRARPKAVQSGPRGAISAPFRLLSAPSRLLLAPLGLSWRHLGSILGANLGPKSHSRRTKHVSKTPPKTPRRRRDSPRATKTPTINI